MTFTRAENGAKPSVWKRAVSALLGGLLVALGLVMVSTTPAAAEDVPLPEGYFICHANGNATTIEGVKSWVTNEPANSGQASGHAGLAHQNGLDIIPPIPGVLDEGQNWTAYGQQVHALGCNLPAEVNVTFTDNTCVSGDYVAPALDAPDVEGTSHKVTGSVAPGSTVTVTYTAKQGYAIAGESVFTHTFPAQPDGAGSCRIAVPQTPGVTDPCGPGNATWNVPADTATIDWTLRVDGHLVAQAIDTKFADGSTTHDYGTATDSGKRCVVAVPDAPGVTDPCGSGNATWDVPADTATIDWTLRTDGHLVADTVGDYEFGDGTTTHDYGTATDSGKRCVVAVPGTPDVTDPCGSANATWDVPADTATIDWTLRTDGHLVADTLGDNEFGDGTTTHDYGTATDSGALCETPLPAEPAPNDPCGLANASWVLPTDTAEVTWRIVDGDLIADTTADYVFGTGETSHHYGTAVDSGVLCETPVPVQPTPYDPCGLDNASWVLPTDTAEVTWRIVDGDLIADTTADYAFDNGETSHNYGAAEDSSTPCQVPVPAEPEPDDPCGLANATWVLPTDTVSVTWEIVDGDLVASTTPSYRFDDGTGSHHYGPAVDSGVLCVTPVPAEPGTNDPCGLANASWVLPTDTTEVTWRIVDGDLIAETTADYVFDDGETSHHYGSAVDSGAPCLDAMAVLSTTAPTCTAGETLDLGNVLNATWGVPTRTEGPGDYSVTATATPGHAFSTGDTTTTFTGSLAGALDADDPACIRTIALTPSVTMVDDCGTADDSGPTYVEENEFWTTAVTGDTVVFTAKTGWRFPDALMVSQDGKVWTEPFTPNSTALCRDAVATVSSADATCTSAEVLQLGTAADGGLLEATWGTPTRTEGPGDYSVTATAAPGHAFANGDTTKTLAGTLTAALGPDHPDCIQLIGATPSVTVDDQCGTADDSGPTYVTENEFWTAAVEQSTVVFTAKTGWRFPDGPMVSQDGKVWTEPFTTNSTELCRDAVASATVAAADCVAPDTLVLSDGDALRNATWDVPTLTEGPGDYSVTATAIRGHAFADGKTSRTFTGTLAGVWDGEVYFENCAPEPPAPAVRQVDKAKESCRLGGVATWTDEYTTEYVWDLALKAWVLGEETGPVRVDEQFTPYTFAEFNRLCPPDIGGEQEEQPPHQPQPQPEVKGVQAEVPTVVAAGIGPADPWANRRLPLGLVAIGGGLCLMGVAGWRRRATANR